ncbi:uncharacterized protein HMPREF1541_09002 [Cyphellophora europaea CBS 101466]|uniref:Amine oxidase n=1 Tax=Cyphellophora europaea (strain CBS 101466) TaxID=1220924 RepID=W2RLW4_CYPE1|nr:uncharacterized protein HMPREF1541_09002 [Cyphellophora europaea CBS 101466]ETN36724.1 hypothetical protein HMPREF1541_09002 [Cyphellophora europaea CBS 101466]
MKVAEDVLFTTLKVNTPFEALQLTQKQTSRKLSYSIGHATNNLNLGCDCLGVIKYLDGVVIDSEGQGAITPHVICLHEQDNGIGWKHTNWRTSRAVVTRNRELVVQFVVTLANYDYAFAYKFDLSRSITIETRATGILSVVSIDPGKRSKYVNVASPGVLAQNYEHVICVRMDPAIDGYDNTVRCGPKNPVGNLYEVRREPVEKSKWVDATTQHNFTPADTQLLLAQRESIQAQRALFAQHHVWITRYLDQELYAGGRYPLQSKKEVGGVGDAGKRENNACRGPSDQTAPDRFLQPKSIH